MLIRFITLIFLVLASAATSFAQGSDPKPLFDQLADANFNQAETLVGQIAATGDPRVVPALNAFSEGDLYFRKSDKAVFSAKSAGSQLELIDPVTGESAGHVAKGAVTKIKVNNNLRRAIRAALGGLTLMSPDRGARLSAADAILRSPSAEALELVEAALAKETDTEVKARMEEARAVSLLSSDRSIDEKRAAIETISGLGASGLGVLNSVSSSIDPSLKPDLDKAIASIQNAQQLWNVAQNVWYGMSLGSVLLLAAIGLAITFGVMGIINMAHGEMVMLGAYSTFMVQEVIRENAPSLFDWSLAIALPVAFLVTGFVGFVIERGVIRFLYGRPLETLLATWGVSLILQQAIRTIFGPTNQEVGNPSWMSGSFPLGGMTITYNRMWIIVFSLTIFFALLFVMKKTAYGLNMRAVTQNRRMASSMGIRTPWVDALTFALGSGIAGIAGVALSQIDNVSPNLGQSYIIDSFMVVVFGGVGNLWGTLVGALSLGILNKFLEPSVGAVLGKILVLVLIILFIQKRPRGLFALKGRAVEA
ncbi:urea ABC transporter permease subunit UrtB [Aliirhizobium cellulosilyticum]|jgi:urea transport system permease protein|uniref:Urea transport system permease protein n=1 Tax=Aliirhizobium cellulosilyticum TaxID=393664 RepID=A0A7W6WNH6_9HYPH|nr:urea ABC transporter permease subunit UrtB [Rhizobium cellulosilyticum]MBB4346925.1 urea transport system permease protein [Rhizobium cellulosilyticum]MBB4410681.1 urea transport system permease protein [Rhizobium cellulosilyticum]MBB4445369.1 urea transport system permease protein [Rhizobium cellulosilyticum]